MIKNIIIAVLAIIIIATVFYAQSQALEALSVKEQLEAQVKEEQKKAAELVNLSEHTMAQMLEQKMAADSLRQILKECK